MICGRETAPEDNKLKTIDYDIDLGFRQRKKSILNTWDARCKGEQMKKWIKKSFHRQLLVCFGSGSVIAVIAFWGIPDPDYGDQDQQ